MVLDRNGGGMREKLALVVGAATTVGWMFNLVAPAFIRGYQSVDAVNGIFMAVVGALILESARRKRGDDDDEK